MTDQEDRFWKEVSALARWDEDATGRLDPATTTYDGYAAHFREIARRAMTCAFRAEEAQRSVEEAAHEPRTARPDLEPE